MYSSTFWIKSADSQVIPNQAELKNEARLDLCLYGQMHIRILQFIKVLGNDKAELKLPFSKAYIMSSQIPWRAVEIYNVVPFYWVVTILAG